MRKQKVKTFGDDSGNTETYTQSQQLQLQKRGGKCTYKNLTIKTPEQRSDVFNVKFEHLDSIINPERVT